MSMRFERELNERFSLHKNSGCSVVTENIDGDDVVVFETTKILDDLVLIALAETAEFS